MELVKNIDFLRQPSKPIGLKKGIELGRQMLSFLDKYNKNHKRIGIGLAAPQVGILSQVCVLAFGPTSKLILVNPKIVSHSKYQLKNKEGCLSLPAYLTVDTYRWLWVQVEADNWEGQPHVFGPFIEHLKGGSPFLWSAAVQHECDHLEGLLITDRTKDLSNVQQSN